jgi:predicted nucleic acid-binding protein
VKWLLDSNVVSEPVREKPSSAVVKWLAAKAKGETAISIVTLAELRDGAASARQERKRQQLTTWVESEITQFFEDHTLPLSLDILLDWIALSRRLRRSGRTRDPADLLIAATARVHNLILVSRNTRHFAGTGLVVYDPWNDELHRPELA